jgi:hypothetical protein
MTGVLQLTEQFNPLAQTFRVIEPGGSVLTGVGLFFSSAPSVTDLQIPVTVELRPVVNGQPSSTRFIPGTRVAATASQIRSVASTSFSSATEYKFTFREPVYIPGNTEVALVAFTNAPVGQYKIWAGTIGEHISGSTTALVSHQLNSGVLYQSSNGTSWSADQFTDLAFKVYRAVFNATGNMAYLVADTPPIKRLTENTFIDDPLKYPSDPLIFTASSNLLKVIHPSHGFVAGDKVVISTDSDGFNSSSTVNGVLGSSILGTRTIIDVDPYGYTFNMDSAADSSVRAGGIGVMATEQYVIDRMLVNLPRNTPPNTGIGVSGTLTTHKSFAGNQTAYAQRANIQIALDNIIRFEDPYVIASAEQESDATKLNGVPSTIIRVAMDTQDKYVAPYINVNAASLKVGSYFIDYQDSDNTTITPRNTLVTLDYVPETEPEGGTTASKHLTIPYTIENVATSIRVLVDAVRPVGSDFSVWYRTTLTTEDTPIDEVQWTEFSKTINPPNKSNYSEIGNTNRFREYQFNVYDIAAFDQYQIKITMNSTSSTKIPTFRNLRTIATV